jgi:hypothetical protein
VRLVQAVPPVLSSGSKKQGTRLTPPPPKGVKPPGRASSRWFCIGVPDSSTRRRHATALSARLVSVWSFFRRWACVWFLVGSGGVPVGGGRVDGWEGGAHGKEGERFGAGVRRGRAGAAVRRRGAARRGAGVRAPGPRRRRRRVPAARAPPPLPKRGRAKQGGGRRGRVCMEVFLHPPLFRFRGGERGARRASSQMSRSQAPSPAAASRGAWTRSVS